MSDKNTNNVEDLRQNYDSHPLTKDNINQDPLTQFDLWMKDAIQSEILEGNDLIHNPRATLVFFWDKLQRQVRITGIVRKISAEDSTAYFKKRPIDSQMGALASPQSQEISDRKVLQDNLEQIQEKYEQEKTLDRPEHWGGYTVVASKIEFWQGQSSRLHDRIEFELTNGTWKKKRLAP